MLMLQMVLAKAKYAGLRQMVLVENKICWLKTGTFGKQNMLASDGVFGKHNMLA